VLWKGVFTAKKCYHTSNVCEECCRKGLVYLFKPRPRYKMAHKPRYSFVVKSGLREILYSDGADSRFWVKGAAAPVEP